MPENQATTPLPDAKVNQSQEPQKVELDADTYAALLDRLDELENRQPSQQQQQDDDDDSVDSLARQAAPQPLQGQKIDLDRMSNGQLAQFIARELSNDVINPMLVKLSQIELRMEEQTIIAQYPDFKDIKKDVYNILHKNPSLTLERAYKLAKAEQPSKSEKTSGDSEQSDPTKKGRLRHLPPRPTSIGEKPSGAAKGAISPAKPVGTRAAVERALDDLEVDFPTKGGNI